MPQAKEGRFNSAISSMATGLGLRKSKAADQTTKLAEKKLESAKIIPKTSLQPIGHNARTSASSIPSPSLANQTDPSSKTLSSSKKRSSTPSKASIKPKGVIPNKGSGSSKKLKISHSRPKETSSSISGQKLVKKKKIVLKKKVSTHPRTSSSTLSGSKSKVKSGSSLVSGNLKRKIKPKKMRALTIVSTVVKSPTPALSDDQNKNKKYPTINKKLPDILLNTVPIGTKITTSNRTSPVNPDTRIYTRAPLENALLEALRTENINLDDTLRVRGGGITGSNLQSSSAGRSAYNQPCLLGIKNIQNAPFYTPEDATDWYNDIINKNVPSNEGCVDLGALPTTMPKIKTSSDQNNNGKKSNNPPKGDNSGSASNSSTGSKETSGGSSMPHNRTNKDDDDPDKRKNNTNDKKDDKAQSTASSSRKRVTFSCVDTPFIINNSDFENNNRKVVKFYFEPWQKVNHNL